jgi:hypothetical protein
VDQGTPHKTREVKLIEKKVGKSLEDMGTGEKFLMRTAMACDVKLRIDKWDLIKLLSFCKAKDTVNKTKRPPTDWERIFTNPKAVVYFNSNFYLAHFLRGRDKLLNISIQCFILVGLSKH